jgi:cytochrome c biogenesis protein CcdA
MTVMKKEKDSQHFTSVMMAYFILLLHVILVAALVLMVIFFRGIINYLIWIFIVGSIAIIVSGYHFYKRMKKEQKTLGEILDASRFNGRSIEVSFLGGLASLKIGRAHHTLPALDSPSSGRLKQLEDPESARNKEFSELVRLLENNLITLEEYNKFKEEIFKS